MGMRRSGSDRSRGAVLAVIIAIATFGAASMASAAVSEPGPITIEVESLEARSSGSNAEGLALYNGRLIDLSVSWEGAGACLVAPDQLETVECFGDESELELRVAQLETSPFAAVEPGEGAPLAASSSAGCGSYLKLYDYYYYGGSSLWIATTHLWMNLSNYGFNQRTSSFKIGACSAYFADYSWGGGAWYPTYRTQAYDVEPIVVSGWNNDVSSLYIT